MNLRLKTHLVFWFFAFAFLSLLGRAFWLQVIDSERLIRYAESQYIQSRKVFPTRGTIYDRSGRILATSINAYNIYAIPPELENVRSTINRLNRIIGKSKKINRKKIVSSLKKRKKFTWVIRQVVLNELQVKKLKKLKGIFVEKDDKRVYPNGNLLSQVLGFVNIDNEGLSGLEYKFNKDLSGEPQVVKYFRDAKGRPVKISSTTNSKRGKNLHLTINKDLQAKAEEYLEEAVKNNDADMGGIGMMDVETGEILALANYPNFDPNFPRRSKVENRKLSFVTDPFEAGSVMKVFTVGSGIENEVINPNKKYYCERGRLKIGKYTVKEAETTSRFEWLTVSEIIKNSSNIGSSKIAFDLSYPVLKSSFEKYNMTKKTGIELPGESRGIFAKKKRVSKIELSNLSFGQGIATTGVQILSGFAAILRGGEWIRPTLIKGTQKDRGRKRIMSKKTTDELVKMMISVVESGTAKKAKLPHFVVGGKTSTAQLPSKKGGYEGYLSGFVGFVLNSNKKFVSFTYLKNPKKEKYYGGEIAAPVFKKLASYYLYKMGKIKYLSRSKKDQEMKLPKIEKKKKIKKKSGLPNFSGKDRRSVEKYFIKSLVEIEHIGHGLVKKQEPGAGTPLSKVSRVKLFYEIPKL